MLPSVPCGLACFDCQDDDVAKRFHLTLKIFSRQISPDPDFPVFGALADQPVSQLLAFAWNVKSLLGIKIAIACFGSLYRGHLGCNEAPSIIS